MKIFNIKFNFDQIFAYWKGPGKEAKIKHSHTMYHVKFRA